jgi:N-acetylmuramoyl-L-alanine amidase-like protein
MTDDFDTDIPLLPFDTDSNADTPQKPRPAVLGAAAFAYDGRALTIEQFATHCAGYNFGSVPPDYVVLHHTANPDASWAPLSSDVRTKWDRNEHGMSEAQIKLKRKLQLDGIMHYYRDTLHWNAGPHLFCDDKYIWLFTPMYDVGIHAASGNSYRDSKKKLHYSIGIEVVGYYEHVRWPEKVAHNVGMALAILRRRLGTFSLDYRPGPLNAPQAHVGSISSHRDYNKPSCPGKAITEAFYVGVAQAAWKELTGGKA